MEIYWTSKEIMERFIYASNCRYYTVSIVTAPAVNAGIARNRLPRNNADQIIRVNLLFVEEIAI